MSTESHATIVPADPAKLLRTLCNHWRHKFEIQRPDDAHAYIPFGEFGEAWFAVEANRLDIRIAQPDNAQRERLQEVMEIHLRRFERNEALAFEWRGTA